MESVRACKSRSIHLSLDSRHQPGRVPGNPASNGGDALASLHVYGWTRVSSADRKAVADWRMPTGVVSSLSATVFLHSYSTSLSLSLLPSVARRKERFTRPAIRLHTFETCVNGGREATWGNSHRGTLQRNSWKFYSWFLRERRRYIYIRGSFLEEGRGTSWRNKLV